MEPDILICKIITHYMALDAERVVVYDEGFEPPKDEDIYIVVSHEEDKEIGTSAIFDDTTNEETVSITNATRYSVEITSKNRDALIRKEEIKMAMKSFIAQRYCEDNEMSVFKVGNTLDLSFIEGASSLHRYRTDVIIHHLKKKTSVVDYFDKFRNQEVIE